MIKLPRKFSRQIHYGIPEDATENSIRKIKVKVRKFDLLNKNEIVYPYNIFFQFPHVQRVYIKFYSEW